MQGSRGQRQIGIGREGAMKRITHWPWGMRIGKDAGLRTGMGMGIVPSTRDSNRNGKCGVVSYIGRRSQWSRSRA